jgi:hypothetical protein
MTRSELIALTTRLRRDTRSVDVIALCDEAERLSRPTPIESFQEAASGVFRAAPKRDRAAYMRGYRRASKEIGSAG